MSRFLPESTAVSVTIEEIDSFSEFARERLNNGGADSTIDELFDEWRYKNPPADVARNDLLAIKASLLDMKNGETGRPFDEFITEFRRRKSLPEQE